MSEQIVNVTVGRGTAVHTATDVNGALIVTCGADSAFRNGSVRRTTAPVTCKRCKH